jgi:arginase
VIAHVPAVIQKRYAIVEAPSILGLKPTGVEQLPSCLLSNGLAERLQARYAGRVEPLPYDSTRDRDTLTLNARGIAAWSPRLADAVEQVLDAAEFPVILGGDCSILLGSSLALRRRGRFGLLFIDGHADFYQPEAEPAGEAASMDLALATGHGPKLLANIEHRGPLIRPDDAVAFGFRDAEDQMRHGSQPLPPTLLGLDLPTIRRIGVESAVALAVERLARSDLEGFLVHLDADSLDDQIMPAVDYRLADGFGWDEMRSILSAALSTGRAVGLELTIYNPALDETGQAGRELTDMLVRTLGTSVRSPVLTPRAA